MLTTNISKSSDISKQEFLLAHGSFDTLIEKPDQEYKGVTLKKIAALLKDPAAEEKLKAPFFLPSSYRAHDGRSHDRQREAGQFWFLALDIDQGSPSITEVKDAVTSIIGDAAMLIYSSASASQEEQKWRVLIPIAEHVSGQDYTDLQLSLFEMMQEQGITCDRALSRPGQPIFLPNIPPARRDSDGAPLYYHCAVERGVGFFVVKGSGVWSRMEARRGADRIAMEQAAAHRAQRAAERAQRAMDNPDDINPVDAFNAAHEVSQLLSRYGYEQQGRSDNWRSRYQTTGSYATKDFGDHWVSLSGSDAAAGIGQVKSEYCWGDAFDLYCHYEHDGDMTAAVRAYGKEMRGSEPPRSGLDDFEIVKEQAREEITRDGSKVMSDIFWADDAQPVLENSYLVKGWLGQGQLSCIYGQSNTGKSFLALDMAYHVAASMPWQGNKIDGGCVLYLATEGGNAFRNRVYALHKHYGFMGAKLAVRPSPVDLFNEKADTPKIAAMCEEISKTHGPIKMVVVDTLARAMRDGDENTAQDMSKFVYNCDILRDATDAHVMIVHHSGKDASKGARGSSALRAALDTEIELETSEDGSIRFARATKQRDIEGGSEFVFKLNVVDLGVDQDLDPVTTCVVLKADESEADDAKVKWPYGKHQKLILECYRQLRGEGVGKPNPSGVGWPESGTYWVVKEDDLKEHFNGKADGGRNSFRQTVDNLIASGHMVKNDGFVWPTVKEGRFRNVG